MRNWGVAVRFRSVILRGTAIAWLASVCVWCRAEQAGEARQSSHPAATPDTNAQYAQGASRFEAGDYGGAVRTLEPLRGDPTCAEGVLYMLEESYRRTHKGADARQAFIELSSRYPDSALLHKLMGMAYDEQGDFQNAVREFEAALQKDPNLTEVRFGIGLAYLKLHEEGNAEKWMRAEVDRNTCHAMALYYLGNIEQTSGRLPAAQEHYANAVECSPKYVDAHIGLGTVLEAQGRDKDALAAFRRAVESDPQNSAARYRLGRALAKVGQVRAAQEEFAKARELKDAADARAAANLGNTKKHPEGQDPIR